MLRIRIRNTGDKQIVELVMISGVGADVPAVYRRLLPGQGPQVDRIRSYHFR